MAIPFILFSFKYRVSYFFIKSMLQSTLEIFEKQVLEWGGVATNFAKLHLQIHPRRE
jgi:hypothetical protein